MRYNRSACSPTPPTKRSRSSSPSTSAHTEAAEPSDAPPGSSPSPATSVRSSKSPSAVPRYRRLADPTRVTNKSTIPSASKSPSDAPPTKAPTLPRAGSMVSPPRPTAPLTSANLNRSGPKPPAGPVGAKSPSSAGATPLDPVTGGNDCASPLPPRPNTAKVTVSTARMAMAANMRSKRCDTRTGSDEATGYVGPVGVRTMSTARSVPSMG